VAYLKALHSLVTYLGISDGNMAEGSMRCDINLSLRPPAATLGTRTEIKNVNSFRFVEKAIEFEIERQEDILEDGGSVVQETRLYDADRDETRSMRSKEVANDYRYFPEPDLLPVVLDEAFISSRHSPRTCRSCRTPCASALHASSTALRLRRRRAHRRARRRPTTSRRPPPPAATPSSPPTGSGRTAGRALNKPRTRHRRQPGERRNSWPA
jgi:hypothetical protein